MVPIGRYGLWDYTSMEDSMESARAAAWSDMMEYTVVIPAHNESSTIESHVNAFIETLPSQVVVVLKEIIIVENGSTDGTLDACRRLAKRFPRLIRVFTIERGSYGEAIKRGMCESSGTHLSILECDFLDSAFLGEIDRDVLREEGRSDYRLQTASGCDRPATFEAPYFDGPL